MNKILITAFEPFGKDTINPTEAILDRIPDFLYDVKVIKQTLPVVYNHAFERLVPLIEKHNPELILLLGLAKGRSHVSLERIAINVSDGKIPDNLGTELSHETIETNGPDGLFSTLPLKTIEKRFKQRQQTAVISNTAGTYVCNNLYYKTLHYVKTFSKKAKVGFIHVPATPAMVYDQAGIPSMRVSEMYEAIMTIIDTVINPVDIKETGQKVKGAQKAK